MRLTNTIFPFKTHLAILQLEEYKLNRYLTWIVKNYFSRNLTQKKPFVLTQKIKKIILFTIFWQLVSLVIHPLLFIFFLLNPFISLTLAVLTLRPYEIYNKYKTIQNNRQKIIKLKNQGLKVIGITGSFGKTSTKEILFQILKNKYRVLRTPESYNTIFGISKVIEYELDENYDFFICEMAAYTKGEIKTLTEMVPPDYGIITGITKQHLERFKSLKNIVTAKFELFEAVNDTKKFIFNLHDKSIFKEVSKRKISQAQDFLKTSNIILSQNGSKFDLTINNKKYKINTSLFGFPNIENITAAATLARLVGMPIPKIINAISNLTPVENRFVLQSFQNSTIVNNTYSSNVKTFKKMLKTAKQLTGSKVLITPGLVELGKDTERIHQKLGFLSESVFKKIILVGKNKRTLSFTKKIKSKNKIKFISDTKDDYLREVDSAKLSYDWVFLENDLTQNY